jgi:hypothetical protein
VIPHTSSKGNLKIGNGMVTVMCHPETQVKHLPCVITRLLRVLLRAF